MTSVELHWSDTSSEAPAADVLVRLVALTDNAYEEGRLDAFLMDRVSPREWVWNADLPDDLRTTYQFCPVRDHPLRGLGIDEQRWHSVIALGEPDPREDDQLPPGCVFGAVDQGASVLSMPGATPQPWVGARIAVSPSPSIATSWTTEASSASRSRRRPTLGPLSPSCWTVNPC